ncbi:MAG: peptidylprolyl isomerase [Crocinitomicaceae bacterium]|nr:peptidylprolyl isomerase [Crocinitomicaceae bacterium]
MKNLLNPTAGVACMLFVAAFTAAPVHAQDEAVLTVGEESVSLADFEHIFLKNNRDSVITEAALDEYMELFINFKLKVQAAEALGMDTVETFQKELAGYRTQLARPYLTNNELLDELVRQAWERKQEEVRARHILVSCSAQANPADTLKARKRANAMRTRILNGEDFEAVALSKAGSDDPSVRDNGGDLGWFSAFQMVYPFEEAAYTTAVGDLSPIVRTRYGYHFLEVTGRRDARGEIRAAHIMIRTKEGADDATLKAAEERINSIYDLLGKGIPWEELALKMSEDASTASKAGELPWFGTGKMVEEFENAAFGLTEDGQISAPFKTSYGWHIVKRLEYRAPAAFEASKRELQKKVSRDSRSELTRASFLENLKAEYNYTANATAIKSLKRIAAKQDSVFFPGHPLANVPSKTAAATLLTIGDESATVADFVDYLNIVKIRNAEAGANTIIDEQLTSWSDKLLLDYEDARLEAKHDDFRLLMEEYHDGILLFELTDEKVWSKAVKDTAGLEAYHAAHVGDFMWGTRAEVDIFTCADEKAVKAARKAVKKGKDLVAFQRDYNAENGNSITLTSGRFSEGANTWGDKVLADAAAGTLSEKAPAFATYEGGGDETVLVHVGAVRSPEPKTLAEARGQVIAAYQDHLEAEWIEALRAGTTVEVNRALLQTLAD